MRLLSIILLFAGLAFRLPTQEKTGVVIRLKNARDFKRGGLVEVDWKEIVRKFPDVDTANFRVLNLEDGKEVAWQLSSAEFPGSRQLLVRVEVPPLAEVRLSLIPGKPAAVEKKVYGRYVPERFDDFAWENDKVAHRMYGKALENRNDNAFGTDVWVKRTGRLVIDDWYRNGDYHTDRGEGMDYYSVGFTLGGGDIAPFAGDSIFFSRNYRTWKILENGPLRFTFQLSYDDWDVAGRTVSVVKTISLDAGSQINKVRADYRFKGKALPVVMGVVKRDGTGKVAMSERSGILGYWEPQHGRDGTTGIGIVYPGKPARINEAKGHFLVHAEVTPGQPVTYYYGSAWDKAGEYTTADQWFKYLGQFAESLRHPVQVQVFRN